MNFLLVGSCVVSLTWDVWLQCFAVVVSSTVIQDIWLELISAVINSYLIWIDTPYTKPELSTQECRPITSFLGSRDAEILHEQPQGISCSMLSVFLFGRGSKLCKVEEHTCFLGLPLSIGPIRHVKIFQQQHHWTMFDVVQVRWRSEPLIWRRARIWDLTNEGAVVVLLRHKVYKQ